MRAEINVPAVALPATTAIVEQDVVASSVERARPGEHVLAHTLEAMDENDGWRVGRAQREPPRKMDAIARCEAHVAHGQSGGRGVRRDANRPNCYQLHRAHARRRGP